MSSQLLSFRAGWKEPAVEKRNERKKKKKEEEEKAKLGNGAGAVVASACWRTKKKVARKKTYVLLERKLKKREVLDETYIAFSFFPSLIRKKLHTQPVVNSDEIGTYLLEKRLQL